LPLAGVGADLGAQDADQLAAGGDGAHPGGDRVVIGVVAAAQPALQPPQVIVGALQLAGPVGGRGLGAGRGPHQHPPQRQDGVSLALAGQGHGVLDDPVAAPPLSRLVLVAGRDVVDRGGSVGVEGGEDLGGHVGLGGRRDEADLGVGHGPQVGVGEQLGVTHQQQPLGAGQLLERGHGADDLGDLAGAAVVGAVEDGDPAVWVAGDRQAGLDLLEVGAAVLGMAMVGSREPVGGVGVGAVQRDRREVPVQPGNVQAEHADRAGADRPDDVVQLRRGRVQGPADAVIVEHGRLDPPDLLHGPLAGPVLDVDQRRRRGQPVGDQRLDDLPVGDQCHLADRHGPVDDPGHLQPPAELRDHRQRPQRLVQAGRTELGSKPGTGSHRRTLPHPSDNTGLDPTPDLPTTMCGRQG
jgi:hypothetical protein